MSRLTFRRPKSEYDDGILTIDFTKTKHGRELMQTFIKTSDKRITECILNKGKRTTCYDYKQELIEWNPNATLPTNFSKNSITSETPYVWSKKNSSFKKTISKDELFSEALDQIKLLIENMDACLEMIPDKDEKEVNYVILKMMPY